MRGNSIKEEVRGDNMTNKNRVATKKESEMSYKNSKLKS